jgi:hypothetical protein
VVFGLSSQPFLKFIKFSDAQQLSIFIRAASRLNSKKGWAILRPPKTTVTVSRRDELTSADKHVPRMQHGVLN